MNFARNQIFENFDSENRARFSAPPGGPLFLGYRGPSFFLFHSFYKNCPIITASSNTKIQRTALLLKTKEILKVVFSILGISAPEKM